MLERFDIPEQLMGHLENIISAVLILIIGLIIMKLVLHIVRKTLEKSTIDEVLYHFIIKYQVLQNHIVIHFLINLCKIPHLYPYKSDKAVSFFQNSKTDCSYEQSVL